MAEINECACKCLECKQAMVDCRPHNCWSDDCYNGKEGEKRG